MHGVPGSGGYITSSNAIECRDIASDIYELKSCPLKIVEPVQGMDGFLCY